MKNLKYLWLWLGSFIFISAVDAVWHLVLFGRLYKENFQPVARMKNGQLDLNGPAGLLSQILVVSMLIFLVLYKRDQLSYQDSFLIGAAGGVLAITVYGLVNFALIKNWGLTITLLEVVWGPLLGGLGGVFIHWLFAQLFK